MCEQQPCPDSALLREVVHEQLADAERARRIAVPGTRNAAYQKQRIERLRAALDETRRPVRPG